MPLSIKNPETERLARRLAARTGESITVATRRALEERLARTTVMDRDAAVLEELASIRCRWRDMPRRDDRSADEIKGHDADGLPG